MRTTTMPKPRLVRVAVIGLIAVGGLVLVVTGLSAGALAEESGPAAQGAVMPSTIDRDEEPVIVTGADVPHLQGAPTDDIFVYAHDGGSWEQIPFQVDERDGAAYLETEDALLDGDDEIVFMASDLGGRPADEAVTATLPISPTWYRVEVTDPLSPTKTGWAYVVRSSSLSKTFAETYASFDAGARQIATARYAIGYAEDRPYFDYLALNGSGIDIVDRSKVRVHTNLLPAQTEESSYLELSPLSAVKEGPVRVVARQGNVMGYAGALYTTLAYTLDLPSFVDVTLIRASLDFSNTVVTSTFYNGNLADGVPVDGDPDDVEDTPLSPWWQLSGETGTVVQVSDAQGTSGTPMNYYKDDDTTDLADTGDGKSYGDAGIKVESPGSRIRYRTVLYVLPPDQDNVGASYWDYYQNPLDVEATPVFRYRIYVPLVLRQ